MNAQRWGNGGRTLFFKTQCELSARKSVLLSCSSDARDGCVKFADAVNNQVQKINKHASKQTFKKIFITYLMNITCQLELRKKY